MTDREIAELGPAFAAFLPRFRPCFLLERTLRHFDTFCRGWLSNLPRKAVEPIALAAGTAVRTLQLFLTTANWNHELARDTLQRHVAAVLEDLPSDRLGTVGVFDETSAKKQGKQTPGVQRQYLGCKGKVDNGIVTVHVGVARGRFPALLDAELYLPQSWDQDRTRCEEAGIPPDEVGYRPRWRIALEQLLRLDANGVKFDWLPCDEGYGSKVPLLTLLTLSGQRFVAAVPVSFAVHVEGIEGPGRVDEVRSGEDARRSRRHRIRQETRAEAWWRADGLLVRVRGHDYQLVAAINEATAEVKYFQSNAVQEPVGRLLQVGFRRATVEHHFRLARSEAGLMHYEGRRYVGLCRHLTLALIVPGFVAIHTDRLRGEKPTVDQGAGVPGAERVMREAAAEAAREGGARARGGGDPLPPGTQRASGMFPQKAAA